MKNTTRHEALRIISLNPVRFQPSFTLNKYIIHMTEDKHHHTPNLFRQTLSPTKKKKTEHPKTEYPLETE